MKKKGNFLFLKIYLFDCFLLLLTKVGWLTGAIVIVNWVDSSYWLPAEGLTSALRDLVFLVSRSLTVSLRSSLLLLENALVSGWLKNLKKLRNIWFFLWPGDEGLTLVEMRFWRRPTFAGARCWSTSESLSSRRAEFGISCADSRESSSSSPSSRMSPLRELFIGTVK